jgi:hypothetical protein
MLNHKALFELSVDVQAICAVLRKIEPNQIAEYAMLSEVIKADIRISKHRHLLVSALRVLQRDSNHVFATVRGVGVKRIVEDQVVDAAKHPMQKIRTQIRCGAKLLRCVEYEKLSNAKKIEMNATASIYGALEQATRPKTITIVADMVASQSRQLSFGETLELFTKKK